MINEHNCIDLNCDMGEFDRLEDAKLDQAIMPLISRCNIATGGHVGNRETMAYSFKNAAAHGIQVGLHPSYPDREHFGRMRYNLNNDDLVQVLKEQIDLGLQIASECTVKISHIKFHGALYNDLELDVHLAELLAGMLQHYQPLAVMGMAGGNFQTACEVQGITFIREAFADRRYLDQTHLQPRSEAGSVLTTPAAVAEQVLNIATGEPINNSRGQAVKIVADSVCVHSDTPGSIEILKAIRTSLTGRDWTVC